MAGYKKIKIIITILVISVLLVVPLQVSAEEEPEEKYPFLNLIPNKILSIDKIIGDRVVKYYEHIVNGFEIKGDSILIHENPYDNSNILYEKTWTDINFELPDFPDFEPSNYILKKKVVFTDKLDLDDVYIFYNEQEIPVSCWEIIFEDGRTILYDINENKIGYGPTLPSEGFLLSGPDGGDDVWNSWRTSAEFWYKRWVDSYTSIFSPYPPSQISPRVSDPDTELFYELAHGSSSYFQACSSTRYYARSSTGANVEEDMENRPPIRFAFIGSCGGMDSVGDNSFSYEFRKGQMTNTVTVGLTHVTSNPGTFSYTKGWQEKMFAFMDQGYTMYDSFTLATQLKPIVEPIVRFVGDQNLKMREEVVNRDPFEPYYPSPSDTVKNRDIDVNLIWSGGDPDHWNVGDTEDDNVYYDIYFGTNPNPAYKTTIGPFLGNITDFSYDPGQLEFNTQYYWKIIARDTHDAETSSPIWGFITREYSEDLLDQHQIEIIGLQHSIYEGAMRAQTFKPTKNILSKISLLITKTGSPTNNLQLIICDNSIGEPDINNYIISTSINRDYVDREYSWIEFEFPDSYIIPDETYFIILKSSCAADFNNCYRWMSSKIEDAYPNGQFWATFPSNPEWQTATYRDFCFKTYGFIDPSENGIDQSQTVFTSNMRVYDSFITAQSFKPNYDQLARVKLYLRKIGNPIDITVSIRERLDSDDVTSITISSDEFSDEFEIYEFDIPDIDVIPDYQYFIVISAENGDLDNYFELAIGHNTPYDKGDLWEYGKYDTWYIFEEKDLWFKTYKLNYESVYYLNINTIGQGAVSIDPNLPEYDSGTVVELTATASDGYSFNTWLGGITSNDNPIDVTMNSDKTITAEFILIGDAGKDGFVDTGDITKVERMIMDLDPETTEADANQDGRVDAGDITAIEIIIMSES